MKRRRLNIIIGIMTAALIGLIAVQLYWVLNAIEIEEERFEARVSDAMTAVVDKLDKNETAEIIIQNLSDRDNNNSFSWDSKYVAKGRRILINSLKKNKIVTASANRYKNNINFDKKINNVDSSNTSFTSISKSGYDRNDDDDTNFTVTAKFDSFIIKREKIIVDVLEELVTGSSNVKIENRIDKQTIDSLLSEALRNNGINTKFYSAVKEGNDNILFINSGEAPVKDLLQTQFRAQLFPEDIFNYKNYLLVYFPNQRRYIVKSISVMLAISAGLIILIVFVFYKTVRMLITQKKIAEIKNDLINNITHEFKTPLSTISLACEALNEPLLLHDKESSGKYMRIIKDENKRLQKMVDKILNTAFIEKGDFELRKQDVDTHKILLDVINKFELLFKEKSGKITADLTAEKSIIMGDPFHLENIFNNIADNALKYSDNPRELLISTANSKNQIEILFKDNGIGINGRDISRIFDTFYRVPTGDIHNVKGSGIGLSYVKNITALHGGRIEVDSTPGKGSEFKLFFTVKSI